MSVKQKLDLVQKCSIQERALSCSELLCRSQRLLRGFSSSLPSEATLLLEILATIEKFVSLKKIFVLNDFERCGFYQAKVFEPMLETNKHLR